MFAQPSQTRQQSCTVMGPVDNMAYNNTDQVEENLIVLTHLREDKTSLRLEVLRGYLPRRFEINGGNRTW